MSVNEFIILLLGNFRVKLKTLISGDSVLLHVPSIVPNWLVSGSAHLLGNLYLDSASEELSVVHVIDSMLAVLGILELYKPEAPVFLVVLLFPWHLDPLDLTYRLVS